MSSSNETPMLRQYKAIKEQHQDCILFFRLGDFYEMFLEDATIAAKALNLTLTGRGKDENRIPMCGIPYHAKDNYIRNLIEQGHKVAICEQVEAADASKGLTKRDVVRIITPATLLDDNATKPESNNFLMAIQAYKKQFAIALIDYSSGDFHIACLDSESQVQSYIQQCQVKELLIDDKNSHQLHKDTATSYITTPIFMPSIEQAKATLEKHFQVKQLAGFGLSGYEACYPVAAACIDYLKRTQKTQHIPLKSCQAIARKGSLQLDQHSSQHLELFKDSQNNNKNSLFHLLNHCQTPMGSRKLAHLLRHPSCDKVTLERRLNQIEILVKNTSIKDEIRNTLVPINDIERICNKIWSGIQNPKDLIALKDNIQAACKLAAPLNKLEKHPDIAPLQTGFSQDRLQPLYSLMDQINSAILDEPPSHLRDANIFKAGYSPELDDLNKTFKDIRQWINSLEQKEREATQIKALKVRYNKVFGYYMEVPKAQQHLVPESYIRKQTLTNAERYISLELKEKEQIILQGQSQQIQLEQQLYHAFLDHLQPLIPAIQHLCEWVARLDVIQALAHLAIQNNYCRPKFTDEVSYLDLKNNRHPILEQQSKEKLIDNDIHLDNKHNLIILTGPNMAGKSTLMRQIALTVIMAQIGSFVPASEATLSICDQIFSRIGAADNLYAGQSTFMVEMIETANIIHHATAKSLIILDEIGRGTATFDGMSIAAAVLKHLQEHIKAKCLFATHYHELCHYTQSLPGIKNQCMGVKTIHNKLLFTYTLEDGNADSSYGLTVAKMAGLPDSVLNEAQSMLNGLEKKGLNYIKNKKNPISPSQTQDDQLLLWH